MSSSITNYDGAIVTTPQVHVKPKSVEELQEILRDTNKYPASRARDGEQPLAHAVRRVHRHHHRHVRPEGDRQDRRAGHDPHGAGRTAARGSLASASQEEAAVPAQHRDRQHHARLGGVLPDQGRPGRRGARTAQFLRDLDQVGEPVGHARGSVHRQEPRAAAAHPGQLRTRRRRLRGDPHDQAARDRQVRLRTSTRWRN